MEQQTNQIVYQIPEKKINDATGFNKWLTSKARAAYTQFVLDLNDTIKGKKLSELTKLESSEVK